MLVIKDASRKFFSTLLHAALTFSAWHFKSYASVADRALFNVNTHCGILLSLFDKKEVT
jgi:hypothetical protein